MNVDLVAFNQAMFAMSPSDGTWETNVLRLDARRRLALLSTPVDVGSPGDTPTRGWRFGLGLAGLLGGGLLLIVGVAAGAKVLTSPKTEAKGYDPKPYKGVTHESP